jgi:hypothetical protein
MEEPPGSERWKKSSGVCIELGGILAGEWKFMIVLEMYDIIGGKGYHLVKSGIGEMFQHKVLAVYAENLCAIVTTQVV